MPDRSEVPDIFPLILHHLREGDPFALITVLHAAGSTPRKTATRAIVLADGAMLGTIGGGLLESDARRMALDALSNQKPHVFDFRFTGPSAAEPFPVCGGTMRILIDPNPARHREAFEKTALAPRHNIPTLLVTLLNAPSIAPTVRALTGKPPEELGELPGALLRSVQEEDAPRYYKSPSSSIEALIEPVHDRPLLVIFGGGHVGQALARQAVLVGFAITLIEDRPEFARPELFPPGVEILLGDIAEQFTRMRLGPDHFVALVSRGHVTDSRALQAVLHTDAGYIGMMGSRRKVALMRKEFLESGKCTAEAFDRIHAPIGLDIGAQSVPEIAVSIVAQLISIHRARRGRS